MLQGRFHALYIRQKARYNVLKTTHEKGSAMKIGIGIDTGGTYTDAVVYDFEARRILGAAKALTTREDLCLGITEALDGLPAELLSQASILSLSTTLATNACVEDKGGCARLVFFGGDRRVLDRYGSEYGLPPTSEIILPDCRTSFYGQIEQEPDWEAFAETVDRECRFVDGIGIVELYAAKDNAALERKAKEIIAGRSSVPVVCGHELFDELNSMQRGASALLNAQLFPVIDNFLQAIRRVMQQRGIVAPTVVMRSDGSLMTEAFARLHPIETLLCGPASSVMGGYALTGEDNCIVVDMGGTTTDIAIIENGQPVRAPNGVTIGKWRTYVNGLYISTFGLGGDSAVHYRNGKLALEEYRVVPLCAACAAYPQMLERLRAYHASGVRRHSRFRHEFFLPGKEIEENLRYSEEERAFCRRLRSGGPLILEDAAAAMGRDVYTFDVSRLVREGAVLVSGLTPTDIMHIRGDFRRFPEEISRLAAEIVAENLETDTESLCSAVYGEIQHRMYVQIVKLMLAHQDPFYRKNAFGRETEHLIEESYRAAVSGRTGMTSAIFRTDFKLVGIGAPTRLFLDQVARLLGTSAVVPEHAEVANALGAVMGSVYASCSVEIRPGSNSEGDETYIVYGKRAVRAFETPEEAQQFAEEEAAAGARAEAAARGAAEPISVTCNTSASTPQIGYGSVYLGATVTAEAVGAIGLKQVDSKS